MKNVCIVQLTRFGDIIQTLHAVLPIKKNREDISLHLIARKQFAVHLNFLLKTTFDSITYVDTPNLIGENLATSLNNSRTLLTQINSQTYDVLINLSYTKSSSYLCSLINSKFKLGLTRNELGEIAISDKWSQYVFSSVMSGSLNPFNLVDLYKNILGTADMKTSSKTGSQHKKTFNRISIHPFASDKKKSWSNYKWVEVMYGLSKSYPNHSIAILGSQNDVLECERITSNPMLASVKIENLVSKMTIEQTSEVLANSDCFIGNDSMLSHLASMHSTPILTISTGPVRPHESIPYKQGAITVCSETNCYPCTPQTSCDLLTCHKDISHNLVVQLCDGLIKDEEIDANFLKARVNIFHLSNIKIYKTQFNRHNSIQLEEITSNELSYKDVLKLINRIIFELYIGNRDYKSSIPKINSTTAQKLVEDLKVITQLYELYGHGQVFAKRLIAAIEDQGEDISDLIDKIQEIEKLAQITKQYSAATTVLIDFFHTSLKNAFGTSLKEISESYLVGFSDASSLTAMLFELVQQMVSPYIKTKAPETVI